jgi:hypothetical protein
MKAGDYGIRGARNLIIRSGNAVGEYIAKISAFSNSNRGSLIRRVHQFMAAAGTNIEAILHDYPDDIRLALSRLVDENQDLQAAEELEAELADAAGGLLSARDVGHLLPHLSEKSLIDAASAERRILSVDANSEQLFPACQFEGTKILDGIPEVLKAAPTTDGWRILQFLFGKSDGLRGMRPIDLLRSRPSDRARVIAFARTLED